MYSSASSDSFFALRPSLILILPPFFFPIGGCPGLPFFGAGLLFLPCGLPLGAGLLFLPCGLPFGGAALGGPGDGAESAGGGVGAGFGGAGGGGPDAGGGGRGGGGGGGGGGARFASLVSHDTEYRGGLFPLKESGGGSPQAG